MIKEVRRKKLVKDSDYKLLMAICLNFVNHVAWGNGPKTKINRLTREPYNMGLTNLLNGAVEKAVEQSFYHQDLFAAEQSETGLYEAMRNFMAQKHREGITPSAIDHQKMENVKMNTTNQMKQKQYLNPQPFYVEKKTLRYN